jgi:hypothetical protein
MLSCGISSAVIGTLQQCCALVQGSSGCATALEPIRKTGFADARWPGERDGCGRFSYHQLGSVQHHAAARDAGAAGLGRALSLGANAKPTGDYGARFRWQSNRTLVSKARDSQ